MKFLYGIGRNAEIFFNIIFFLIFKDRKKRALSKHHRAAALMIYRVVKTTNEWNIDQWNQHSVATELKLASKAFLMHCSLKNT